MKAREKLSKRTIRSVNVSVTISPRQSYSVSSRSSNATSPTTSSGSGIKSTAIVSHSTSTARLTQSVAWVCPRCASTCTQACPRSSSVWRWATKQAWRSSFTIELNRRSSPTRSVYARAHSARSQSLGHSAACSRSRTATARTSARRPSPS